MDDSIKSILNQIDIEMKKDHYCPIDGCKLYEVYSPKFECYKCNSVFKITFGDKLNIRVEKFK